MCYNKTESREGKPNKPGREKNMTDYEKKLNEVKNDTIIEDFDSYESTDDEQVIIVYYSYLNFTEYVYTKKGKHVQTICHEWHLNKDGQLDAFNEFLFCHFLSPPL